MDEIKYLGKIKTDLEEALRMSGHVDPKFFEIVNNIMGRLTALRTSNPPKSKFMEEFNEELIRSKGFGMHVTKDFLKILAELIDKHKEDKGEKRNKKIRSPSPWTRSYYCESVGHISGKTIKKYIEE